MTQARGLVRVTVQTLFVLASTAPVALALPTMVRLGYTDCAACHISPQGSGPLNAYGRSIDKAQSLRGGEYQPSQGELARMLTWGGRITQDLRFVLQEQATWVVGQPPSNLFRPRLMYRNVTAFENGLRLAATITGETEHAPRPALDYDPSARAATTLLNTLLLHYRPSKSVEFAIGRDQLPTGVNIPDLATFIRSRNRLGYYDAPTQVKMFWAGTRYQVTPFAYAPGGNEAPGERESGGGTLVEFDVLGNHRTIAGTTLLRGTAHDGDRRMIGAYARLGFGRWGVLVEHDVTDRVRETPVVASFQQQATYGQVFWAVREWLVASAIGERLHVDRPFEEHLTAGKGELACRLSSWVSIGVNVAVQSNVLNGRISKSLAIQATWKTVN